jgi:hypothetical protein
LSLPIYLFFQLFDIIKHTLYYIKNVGFAQLFDALKGINIVGFAQLFIINPLGLIINMLAYWIQLFDKAYAINMLAYRIQLF